MCIIAVAIERKLTYEEIENCFFNNPDGAGVAWSSGGKNHLRKGFMDVEEFIEFYARKVNALPHVVHFRKATSGGVSPEMTHPFIVDLQSPLRLTWSGKKPLLFHNGVIQRWEDIFLRFVPDVLRELRRSRKGSYLPPGPWSDTRAAAVITAFAGEGILSFLGGKYAVIDRGHVRTYGKFVEEKGILFSNTSYKNIRLSKGGSGFPYTWVPKGNADAAVRNGSAVEVESVAEEWWVRR